MWPREVSEAKQKSKDNQYSFANLCSPKEPRVSAPTPVCPLLKPTQVPASRPGSRDLARWGVQSIPKGARQRCCPAPHGGKMDPALLLGLQGEQGNRMQKIWARMMQEMWMVLSVLG